MARASKSPKKPRSAKKSHWVWRPIRWTLYLFAASILWVGLYKIVPPPVTITMLMDPHGINKDWTSLNNIDRNMVRAVIAAEDGKFCTHEGFDKDAIATALRRNLDGKKLRGGSTISQQTAKNAFLWQGSGWTRYLRKVPEFYFTFLIEKIWGKRRIMEVYLNIAETGMGTYGAEAGAQRYFKKSAANLSAAEAARLAAILPLPKKREAVSPTGFTRRYGNSIRARIGTVARGGYDSCIYQ
jgi:monofunctional biosynthetic peptidoglycan transglycosylase